MAKSIALLAEEIMNGDMGSLIDDTAPKNQPDISKVEVPSSFVQDLMEETQVGEDKVIEPKTQHVEDSYSGDESNMFGNSADQAQQLLDKFNGLLKEAKKVIDEMTTVGMIGVNMGGPEATKPKRKKKKKRYSEDVLIKILRRDR